MKRGLSLSIASLALLALLLGLAGLTGQRLGHAHAAPSSTISTCNETTLDAAIAAATSGDTLTFGCSGTITLTHTLEISKNLTLDGSGQSVTLDGQSTVRVLLVDSGVQLMLKALTIAHGSSDFGGGLDNLGTLSITNSTFANNSASVDGGGLFSNSSGNLTITNSTFSSNSAVGFGGGLFNQQSTLSITNSTFINNSSPDNAAGLLNGGMATISSSTFANNSASNEGGGLENSGTMSITNSIFSSNSATDVGGGLFNNGPLSISSSTFANNSASLGGGLDNVGNLTITGSIVANNGGGNCGETAPSDGGHNLESANTCGFTLSSDLVNIDPKLGPLANNGGPTQTLALLTGSPAIDAGGSTCPSTDQRGVTRPQGPACDIGAFELVTDMTPPVLSLPSSPLTVNATGSSGAVVTYTVTASDPDNPPSQLTISCSPTSGSTFPIGTTTVNCTASDPAGNKAMGSFQVLVKGASTQISDTISLVNSFHLASGLQNSLDLKLQAALNSVNAGQISTACAQLSQFLSLVQAQSGKGLTTSQAAQLTTAATRIKAVLGC